MGSYVEGQVFIFVTSLASGGAMCGIVVVVLWSWWSEAVVGARGAALCGSVPSLCPCLVVAFCCCGAWGSLILLLGLERAP